MPVGAVTSDAVPAAIAGPVAAQPSPPSASVPFWVAPMLGNNPEPTTVRAVETTLLSHEVSIPTTAPPATNVPDESGLLPFLEHTLGEVLAPISLMALIAVVVPGVCGLLLISGVGVRIGYRQAKAGLALRASGIARFAGPGPLGVVGSGGLVALRRPRPVRVLRPQHHRQRASSRTPPSRTCVLVSRNCGYRRRRRAVTSAPEVPFVTPATGSLERLKQLHEVAGRVRYERLAAAPAGDHVTA